MDPPWKVHCYVHNIGLPRVLKTQCNEWAKSCRLVTIGLTWVSRRSTSGITLGGFAVLSSYYAQ
eukprot:5853099-Amphidinium_carterae.1